ncbi:hypothetical protein J6590_083124 [Homalodisca vitripennis]|nr:hypothetical protein J6590_083124 [Homalodisca vitripennis]
MMMVMSLRIRGHFGRSEGYQRHTVAEDLLFGPWPVLEAVLMGIPLPPPPPPRPATHRLPFRPMPIPQPRTIPRIAITPAQFPSGTSRSSSGSNVGTLAPVQPCASADRASTCRKPPTAEPEVDVARQRIRELVLDHFSFRCFISVFVNACSRGVQHGGLGIDVHPDCRAKVFTLAHRLSSSRNAL